MRNDWKYIAGTLYPSTLQGTNISTQNGILKMIFLFPRWDMLIPWRVMFYFQDAFHLGYPWICFFLPGTSSETSSRCHGQHHSKRGSQRCSKWGEPGNRRGNLQNGGPSLVQSYSINWQHPVIKNSQGALIMKKRRLSHCFVRFLVFLGVCHITSAQQ